MGAHALEFEPCHKTNKMSVHKVKTQIRLVTSSSLIRGFSVRSVGTKDTSFLQVDSEDTDQTELMPRLTRIFP